jgi:hypothetical protein
VDALEGGKGADHLEAREPGAPAAGAPEPLACGSGWDFAIGEPHDVFRRDCEQYVSSGDLRGNPPTRASGTPPGLPATVAPTVDVRGRQAIVAAGCAPSAACTGTIRLRGAVGGRRGAKARVVTLSRARFSARAGQVVLVRLPLTRRMRTLSARARRARVVIRARGQYGGERLTRRRVRLQH